MKALLGLPVDGSSELGIAPGSVRVDLCASDKNTGDDGDTGSLSGLHIAAPHETDKMLEIAGILISKGCPMDVVNAKVTVCLHVQRYSCISLVLGVIDCVYTFAIARATQLSIWQFRGAISRWRSF